MKITNIRDICIWKKGSNEVENGKCGRLEISVSDLKEIEKSSEFCERAKQLKLSDLVELAKGKGHDRVVIPILSLEKFRQTDISAMDLLVRSANCLKRQGIFMIEDFAEKVSSFEQIRKFRNCGNKSVMDIVTGVMLLQQNSLNDDQKASYEKLLVKYNETIPA